MIELIFKIPYWVWFFTIPILGITVVFFILLRFIVCIAQKESGEQNIEKALRFFMKKYGDEKKSSKIKTVIKKIHE